MFGSHGHVAARTRYAHVDLGSRIEGASPHRLIGVLFDELTKTLDALAAGISAGGARAGLLQRRARASSILSGLEGSLDHEAGGALARSLSAIYREARRLLGEGVSTGDPAPIAEARAMIAEIAEVWAAIG